MKIVVTGANGFIGRNVVSQLSSIDGCQITPFVRESSAGLQQTVEAADFIVHLAGSNRPEHEEEFERVNAGLTKELCDAAAASGRRIPIVFASSVHVERYNLYGASKLTAERILLQHGKIHDTPVYIFRLGHVIGKWCRPNYNSVVATFCHNIARGLPIRIDDPNYLLSIVYVDDLVASVRDIISGRAPSGPYCEVSPTYAMTVGELAEQLLDFQRGRDSLMAGRVGSGLTRALFATFESYLRPEDFAYDVMSHADERGEFVEMLKTSDCGQVSYFSARPGVTRGGHFHHSKTERFLVIRGSARFRFRHLISGEYYELVTSGKKSRIVEAVPGWTHDITNIGDDELIVMLWSNEVFDPAHPDTFPGTV